MCINFQQIQTLANLVSRPFGFFLMAVQYIQNNFRLGFLYHKIRENHRKNRFQFFLFNNSKNMKELICMQEPFMIDPNHRKVFLNPRDKTFGNAPKLQGQGNSVEAVPIFLLLDAGNRNCTFTINDARQIRYFFFHHITRLLFLNGGCQWAHVT